MLINSWNWFMSHWTTITGLAILAAFFYLALSGRNNEKESPEKPVERKKSHFTRFLKWVTDLFPNNEKWLWKNIWATEKRVTGIIIMFLVLLFAFWWEAPSFFGPFCQAGAVFIGSGLIILATLAATYENDHERELARKRIVFWGKITAMGCLMGGIVLGIWAADPMLQKKYGWSLKAVTSTLPTNWSLPAFKWPSVAASGFDNRSPQAFTEADTKQLAEPKGEMLWHKVICAPPNGSREWSEMTPTRGAGFDLMSSSNKDVWISYHNLGTVLPNGDMGPKKGERILRQGIITVVGAGEDKLVDVRGAQFQSGSNRPSMIEVSIYRK